MLTLKILILKCNIYILAKISNDFEKAVGMCQGDIYVVIINKLSIDFDDFQNVFYFLTTQIDPVPIEFCCTAFVLISARIQQV